MIKSLRAHCPNAFLDCHLMVVNPKQWIAPFAEAGASQYTFHYEATNEHDLIIDQIKKNGMKVGMAIKPKTNVTDNNEKKEDKDKEKDKDQEMATAFQVIEKNIDKLDLVLIMTVEPGFGGQKFMDDMMPKVNIFSIPPSPHPLGNMV